MIDFVKWERLQRQEKALSAEVDNLRQEVMDRRPVVNQQLDLFKRAVGMTGLRARRSAAGFIDEYHRDPEGVINALRADDHPALEAAKHHQQMLGALKRAETALADAEARLNAFRPAYFRAREYAAKLGGNAL